MKNRYYLQIALVVLIGLVFVFSVQAEKSKKMKKIRLPKDVVKVIKEKYPLGKIEEVEKDFEGVMVLEVKVEQGEDDFGITITPEGQLVEQEQELSIKMIPEAVKKALGGKKVIEASKETTYYVVKLIELEKPEVAYEVVVDKNGDRVEIKYSPDGSVLEEKLCDTDDGEKVEDNDDDDDGNGYEDDDDD